MDGSEAPTVIIKGGGIGGYSTNSNARPFPSAMPRLDHLLPVHKTLNLWNVLCHQGAKVFDRYDSTRSGISLLSLSLSLSLSLHPCQLLCWFEVNLR